MTTPPPHGQGPPPYQPAVNYVPLFYVKQRITLRVNRYEVLAANPDGAVGNLLAFAEQKRRKLKEEVIFFADPGKDAAGLLVQGPAVA